MKIYKSTQNELIAEEVKVANNIVTRTIGLLSRKFLNINEGLIILPCHSIHTWFMRFNIDVIFVNKKNKAIATYKNVKPFRILPIHITSRYVIELTSGVIDKERIQKGDEIRIEK